MKHSKNKVSASKSINVCDVGNVRFDEQEKRKKEINQFFGMENHILKAIVKLENIMKFKKMVIS